MSEEIEIKQFSINLYCKKKGDKITLLDHQLNELGSFIQRFNQEKKNFSLFDYKFLKVSIDQLKEYLITQLDVCIICHAEKIKINGFPLKRELILQILEDFF